MDTLIIICAKYLFVVSVVIYLVYLYKTEDKKKFLIYSLASFVLAYIVAVIARHFYFDPRPFSTGEMRALIPHVADNGFPSDHTLLTAAIASVISLRHYRINWYLWLIVAIVGISRVAAGIHHPLDIVGSCLIALISTALIRSFLKKRRMI